MWQQGLEVDKGDEWRNYRDSLISMGIRVRSHQDSIVWAPSKTKDHKRSILATKYP
jgi:hypothetical protein